MNIRKILIFLVLKILEIIVFIVGISILLYIGYFIGNFKFIGIYYESWFVKSIIGLTLLIMSLGFIYLIWVTLFKPWIEYNWEKAGEIDKEWNKK